MLSAYGGDFYEWEQSVFPLNNYRIPNPVVSPDASTSFIVTIGNSFGCSLTDTVRVTVTEDPLKTISSFNMITPNGDGYNDALEFPGLENYERNSLKIFNRWGLLLYSKPRYQQDDERWDGVYQGALLPDGVYYYVLRVNDKEIRQAITLMRN